MKKKFKLSLVFLFLTIFLIGITSATWWKTGEEPIGYWKLNEADDGITYNATDNSTNERIANNTLVLFNSTDCKLNNCGFWEEYNADRKFNIGADTIYSFNESFTIAMWFKVPNTYQSGINYLMSSGEDSNNWYFALQDTEGLGLHPRFVLWSDVSNLYVLVNNSYYINDSSWHRIVAVLNGTTTTGAWKLYIDNNQIAQLDVSEDQTFSGGNNGLFIGGRTGSSFEGKIDDVQLWNIAWTDDDITEDWNNGDGKELDYVSELPSEENNIDWVESVSAVTLNGLDLPEPKTFYILFNVSGTDFDDTFAKIEAFTGDSSEGNWILSNFCVNDTFENQFNCSMSFNFWDTAGEWTINASIQNTSGDLFINQTQTFIVNALDYVTQDVNSVAWASATSGTNDNEADNTIILTNGGNQDYVTCNIKAYDLIGENYANLISANQFSIANSTGQTEEQIYLINDTLVDVSSKINLNSHSSSTSTTAFFYVDVPTGLLPDNYSQINEWSIIFS
jgi:hypothetical protein